ncbi:MAG: hypothetical protein FWG38_02060 [Defluviitaleaceae bacterium]|nr:hypothetical protein [Defluviitaleaceae bacterium]
MDKTKPFAALRCLAVAKSLAILGLAALAVFLTVQLWLVNIPNRSFFPYLSARFTVSAPDGGHNFVRPFRIVSGTGDGTFNIAYSKLSRGDFWEYGQSVVAAVLQNGTFVERTPTDMTAMLSAPVLIYQYAFDMQPALFAQALNQRASILTDAGMEYFQAVGVALPQDRENPLQVFFITNQYTWQFVVTPIGRRLDPIFDGIIIPPPLNPYRRFVATETPLVFTPDFHQNFSYHPLLATNPYENHSGFLHMASIHSQVEHFFTNPATINQRVDNHVYTFRNLNTVVRYLPWNVVEYTSFRTIGRGRSHFISDFSAAWAFVENDPNITNEFYLANYDDTHGRIFWFNYVVADFPLAQLAPWQGSAEDTDPLPYPIEVLVENGRVLRYRKIPFNFEVDTNITTSPLPAVGAGNQPIGFAIAPGLQSGQDIYLQGIE